MNVQGKHTFNISRSELWSYLMDPEVLAKITPGNTSLELIGEQAYKSKSEIKIGPVKGKFGGQLQVVDAIEPASFGIELEQKSKIGNGHGRVDMTLQQLSDDETELNFEGKVKLSGVIARTGQRVLSGVANQITREVFNALEQHIAEQKVA